MHKVKKQWVTIAVTGMSLGAVSAVSLGTNDGVVQADEHTDATVAIPPTNHITQAMANPEIIAELGRRFKEYRLTYRFTQKEAAEKAGVSLITLRQFENGKAYNINMGNFLALLRVVDCLEQMDDLLPEIPVSAYTMEQIMNKKPKRIRHGK